MARSVVPDHRQCAFLGELDDFIYGARVALLETDDNLLETVIVEVMATVSVSVREHRSWQLWGWMMSRSWKEDRMTQGV